MAAASRSTSEAPRFPPVVLAWNNQGRAGWFPVVPQRRALVPTAGGFPGEMASDLEPTIGPDWRPSPLGVVSNSEPFQHIINSDDVERLAQALELASICQPMSASGECSSSGASGPVGAFLRWAADILEGLKNLDLKALRPAPGRATRARKTAIARAIHRNS